MDNTKSSIQNKKNIRNGHINPYHDVISLCKEMRELFISLEYSERVLFSVLLAIINPKERPKNINFLYKININDYNEAIKNTKQFIDNDKNFKNTSTNLIKKIIDKYKLPINFQNDLNKKRILSEQSCIDGNNIFINFAPEINTFIYNLKNFTSHKLADSINLTNDEYRLYIYVLSMPRTEIKRERMLSVLYRDKTKQICNRELNRKVKTICEKINSTTRIELTIKPKNQKSNDFTIIYKHFIPSYDIIKMEEIFKTTDENTQKFLASFLLQFEILNKYTPEERYYISYLYNCIREEGTNPLILMKHNILTLSKENLSYVEHVHSIIVLQYEAMQKNTEKNI